MQQNKAGIIRSILMAILASMAPAGAAWGAAMEVHIAPDGDDKADGSVAHPLATPAAARDAVRSARKAGRVDGPVTVVLHAGTYELAAPLELTSEDSGSAGSPVVWRAAQGGQVRLLAGRIVRKWAPVRDQALLDRLRPEARGKVLQADLKAQGIGGYEDVAGAGRRGSGPGMELFIDDEPMTLARYPNDGFLRIDKVLGKTVKNVRGTKGCAEGLFTCSDERIKAWAGEADARVHGYWFWDWAEQRHEIASIDAETGTIRLTEPWHGYGYRAGQWFYGFGMLCEIDRPGEWCLDRQRGLAFVWPGEGAKGGAWRAAVSVHDSAVIVRGAKHLTLQALTIEGARKHAVVVADSEAVALVGCTVRNCGGWAIRVEGGRGARVAGCDIANAGDGGIELSGGDRKTLAPGGHVADNNHIHHYSRWNRTYQPGIRLSGVGNRATHNLIHDAPHQAIGLGGNDHVVELNEIHNVCEETNDAGVMYLWNDWAARGNVIRHNYIHHVYGREGRGCMGVYLDDCFSSAHLVGNVFLQVPRAAFIGGGRDNVFENNLFVDCRPALHVDSRGLGWRAYGLDGLKAKLAQQPYRSEPWKSRYPQLLKLLDDEPMTPKGNVIRRNVCAGGKWDNIDTKARPYLKLEDNLVVEDAGFVDLAGGQIRFRDAQAVAKIGFEPIPLARIGLYADSARASWPVKHSVTVRQSQTTSAGAPRKAHPAKPLAVPQAAGEIRVDGSLGAGEYPGPAVAVAEAPSRRKIDNPPCEAHLAHDGRTLYVAVRVPLRKAAQLVRTGDWGAADGMEICLRRPAAKGDKPGPTFIVQGFPDGGKRASTDAGAPKAAADALAGQARYAATVGPDHWTAEWAIPLDAAGIAPAAGATIDFNLGVHRTETAEWIILFGALSQTWQLDNAGHIVLK